MCEHNQNHESEHGSTSKLHVLLMALCCVAPVIVIVVLVSVFPSNSYVSFLVLAICPLSMILMQLVHKLSRRKKTDQHEH